MSVVIPAYNESQFVGRVIETIPEFVDRVFVVDDCSTDGTWETVTSVAASRSRAAVVDGGTIEGAEPAETTGDVIPQQPIVPVRHGTNRGRGAAVTTGYRLAVADGHDVVAVMDGDGQMDPAYLERIVEPVVSGTADYAKGNRLVGYDHCSEMSRWRLFGNALLTMLTKIACGNWRLRDPQNGYTAISAEAIEALELERLYDGYGFLNDLLIRLDAHSRTVVDVPIPAVYGEESSGIRYSTFVPRLSWLLLHGFLWRLWVKYCRPLARTGNDSVGHP